MESNMLSILIIPIHLRTISTELAEPADQNLKAHPMPSSHLQIPDKPKTLYLYFKKPTRYVILFIYTINFEVPLLSIQTC